MLSREAYERLYRERAKALAGKIASTSLANAVALARIWLQRAGTEMLGDAFLVTACEYCFFMFTVVLQSVGANKLKAGDPRFPLLDSLMRDCLGRLFDFVFEGKDLQVSASRQEVRARYVEVWTQDCLGAIKSYSGRQLISDNIEDNLEGSTVIGKLTFRILDQLGDSLPAIDLQVWLSAVAAASLNEIGQDLSNYCALMPK